MDFRDLLFVLKDSSHTWCYGHIVAHMRIHMEAFINVHVCLSISKSIYSVRSICTCISILMSISMSRSICISMIMYILISLSMFMTLAAPLVLLGNGIHYIIQLWIKNKSNNFIALGHRLCHMMINSHKQQTRKSDVHEHCVLVWVCHFDCVFVNVVATTLPCHWVLQYVQKVVSNTGWTTIHNIRRLLQEEGMYGTSSLCGEFMVQGCGGTLDSGC